MLPRIKTPFRLFAKFDVRTPERLKIAQMGCGYGHFRCPHENVFLKRFTFGARIMITPAAGVLRAL
jgi:hypothetical protein